MNTNQFIQSAALLFFTITISCKNPAEKTNKSELKHTVAATNNIQTDSFEVGKIIDTVICKSDPSRSYALYIPPNGNERSLPVIYFFDPHGSGALPLVKYRSLAAKYDFILIGSNDSKNGNDWAISENIINSLFDDTKERLKIDPDRVYTCGFSGGAKVASYAALEHKEVRGVIVGGAGLPDGIAVANFNFSFTIISGEGDMNMTDLVALNNDLDQTQTLHRLLFFNGRHEWCPADVMDIAFTGLQFDAMRNKTIPAGKTFIDNYIQHSKKIFGQCIRENKLIHAENECELSINLLRGLTEEIAWFKQKEASIKNNPGFKQEEKRKNDLLAKEQNLKNFYQQQFQQGNRDFWEKTIRDLQSKSQFKNDVGDMYQRLLAYLSLAFYSISNRFINGNQDNEAQYFVGLYKLADPTNCDAWYFSAILNARNNDTKATEEDLLNAIKYGFTDKLRMEQQPEFENLSLKIDFPEMEKNMYKNN